MRDEGMILNIYCRMNAINAEVEGARLDNQLRILQMGENFDGRVDYPPTWFFEKARELNDLGSEIFKY